MRIVVVGGTGLIGRQLVRSLLLAGHHTIAASRRTGIDTLTDSGVLGALTGADVVVDVSKPASLVGADAFAFFRWSVPHILTAARIADVGHVVVLSVVGCDRLRESGNLRGKALQEAFVRTSGIPYSIVRATQFFEFVSRIADASTTDGVLRLPPVNFQPIASADVVRVLARTVTSAPTGRVADLGGPEKVRMDHFIPAALRRSGDRRDVVTDPSATYFGAGVGDDSLLPGAGCELGTTSFEAWAEAREPDARPASRMSARSGRSG